MEFRARGSMTVAGIDMAAATGLCAASVAPADVAAVASAARASGSNELIATAGSINPAIDCAVQPAIEL